MSRTIRCTLVATCLAVTAALLSAPGSASGAPPARRQATASPFLPCAAAPDESPFKQATALSLDLSATTATTLQGIRLSGRSQNLPAGTRIGAVTPTMVSGFAALIRADGSYVIDGGLPQRSLTTGVKTLSVDFPGDVDRRSCEVSRRVTYTPAPLRVTTKISGSTHRRTVKVGKRIRVTATVQAIGLPSLTDAYQLVASRFERGVNLNFMLRRTGQKNYRSFATASLERNPQDVRRAPRAGIRWTPRTPGTYRIKAVYSLPLKDRCCRQTATRVIVVKVVR